MKTSSFTPSVVDVFKKISDDKTLTLFISIAVSNGESISAGRTSFEAREIFEIKWLLNKKGLSSSSMGLQQPTGLAVRGNL